MSRTSEIPNLHISKILNISQTKQDIEKLKRPLRLVWEVALLHLKLDQRLFCRNGTLTIILFHVLPEIEQTRFESFIYRRCCHANIREFRILTTDYEHGQTLRNTMDA